MESQNGKWVRQSIRQTLTLAEKGVEAKAAARAQLTEAHKFMAESDPEKKSQGGKELIRSIFGSDAIAQDPVL